MIRVISPHLDDAVLSVAQTIVGFTDTVEIVTVFAGMPNMGALTDYDRSCGFSSSEEAMRRRQDEDSAACWQIGARPRHLSFLDRQYDLSRVEATSAHEMVDRLVGAFEPLWTGPDGEPVLVLAPVGVGHPDHELVATAALRALPREVSGSRVGVFLYEELPYRVLQPEVVVYKIDLLRASSVFDVGSVPEPWEQGARGVKAAAVAEYRSQFPNGVNDDPCLLVPERCWRVTRKA